MDEMLKNPSKESVILWPWELKGPIEGPAVMFDVLAASYNIIHLSQRARQLLVVTTKSVLEALDKYPDSVLIGETDNPQLYTQIREKFISSNQPSSVLRADVANRDVVLITNNGTHTISELIEHQANPVIVGHWVNISAVTDYLSTYIRNQRIHLVPSGGREEVFFQVGGKLMEDWACAEAMQDLLFGNSRDLEYDFRRSRDSIAVQYPVPQKEDDLALIFQKDTKNIIPLCYSITPGIIEVKAKPA